MLCYTGKWLAERRSESAQVHPISWNAAQQLLIEGQTVIAKYLEPAVHMQQIYKGDISRSFFALACCMLSLHVPSVCDAMGGVLLQVNSLL